MWVSTLKKRVRFRIRMGFGPTQVSAQDGFLIGTGRFGSGADTGFHTGRVLGRHEFPHGTGFGSQRVLGRHEIPHGTGFRPTRVSARDGFRIATGFRSTRVSARDAFCIATGFRPTRVSAQDGFRIATGFRPTRFQYFQFFFLFPFVSVSQLVIVGKCELL
ncbi:hypothetical protein Hanom_Chr01g00065841 [Helianthus anomalus]